MSRLVQMPRPRRRPHWCEKPVAERSTTRDEHKDCWRDDFRAA